MDPNPQGSDNGRPGSDPAQDAPLPARPDRRALLKAGTATAPVLLTLVSRPVSAGTCVVASSFVSVATFKSHNPTTTSAVCTLRDCNAWYRDACLSPTGLPPRPASLNATVSSLLGTTSSAYNGWPLYAVLQNGTTGIVTTGEIGVLQHIIALALNVKYGYTPLPGGVTVPYLGALWVNYKSNTNRYVVTASGINWDSSQLISWARVLMYPMA